MTTTGARKSAGDYLASDIAAANDAIQLAGDLIATYAHYCPGKRCVIFAVNIDHSKAIVSRYSAAGIPAEHLDGSTPTDHRRDALERFKRGETLVLSNVGLFDEGFDLPELDAVQVARPTASLAKWLQMLGRALRTAPGKDQAILLDHTKNWAIHGLPTRPRIWSLDGVENADNRQPKRSKDGTVSEALELAVVESRAVLEVVTDEPLGEWEHVWGQLLQTQQARRYSPSWVMYQLRDMRPPLEIWRRCAEYLNHKPGWAWHQWKACS
ncbi:DEAD/DEAH box helicase [Nodosilinea sp. AN01ver1]|uniref:DEAD/DEAH box helicase n=1 Tax=Nodosilinea sp. AN01ver1 TaxID=3423362 RepID=UPI003D318E64